MKLQLVGVRRITGKSFKRDPNGREYDMCAVLSLQPIEPRSGDNYQLVGHGYEVVEVECSPEAVASFKNLKFPATVEVVTETDFRGGRIVQIVTGVAPAVSAAEYAKQANG